MQVEIAGVMCCLAALLFAGFYRSYFYLPYRELKRRITRGGPVYGRLELVARHGKLGRVGMVIPSMLFATFGVIYISREFSSTNAVLLILIFWGLLYIFFTKTIPSVAQAAAAAAPYIYPVFQKIRPLTKYAKLPRRKNDTKPIKTELYEKSDLRELLIRQKKAVNNRISEIDLDNALHAIDVRTKKIRDHMVMRKDVHFVNMKEPIGPILLSELHKSGFKCFPVQGNSKHEVVGMLYLDDLVNYTSGGLVTSAMDPKVYYVQEEKKLEQVLQAYTATGKSVFMVLNIREEVVGLITLADVLEELYGQSIYNDFDSYADTNKVAHG